ncbi:MAG: hydantoinase B/oxoprolinase family protein, partial [Alphaproteobacteria bacterium]|nr:hydantoinase B/oxoprolinase family protein [Alphaproteobacteria bacterium]
RTRHPAPGLAGGGDGAAGTVLINDQVADNRAQHHLKSGDTILLATPGGGGYGPADQRDGAAAARDRDLGYVEAEDEP